MIGANGQFDLADGEIVTFNDQFRRGSYISLAEDTNDKLFSTKWEIYENGRLVTNPVRDGTTITGGSAIPDPMQGSGTQPDDGRIERVLDGETDGHAIKNTGYTVEQKPADAKTIVFRSYSDPDGEEMFTKLKVKFINTVKVGTLSITKAQPAGEDALNGCKFTFTIKFTNIGGIGLGGSEGVTKRVTVPVGETVTIHGIPVGTNFTITETQQENSYLQGVTLNGETVSGEVRGAITEEGTTVKAVFTNTGRKLVDLTLNKQWRDANNAPLTGGLPGEIWVQLQRRYAGSNGEWQNVNAPVRLTPDTYTNAWGCVFRSLDAYDANNENKYYEYRVVESATKEGKYTASGTLKLGNYKYKVDSKTKNIAETDESASLTLTNTQVPPVYELAITKQGLDENGTVTGLLNDVEFKLEGLDDTTFEAVTKQTADGGKCSFTGLPAGKYRLTELKTVDGYNLLAAPIEFVLKDGECLINDTAQKDMVKGDAANGFTVSLTINNRKGFTLPHTGADAPSLWLLIGLPLLVAGLLVLVFRYNRKGGKRS